MTMSNANTASLFILDYTNKEQFLFFEFARSITKALTKVITHRMKAHSSEQAHKKLQLNSK